MSKYPDLRIAVTGRARTKIAAGLAPSFFLEVQGPAVSKVSLVIGLSDSELGGTGAPIVVGKKKHHFAFSNPAGLVRMALLGRGFYQEKFPLRAIGVFPSWDRMAFAVRKETGIRSLEEIRESKMPLRISTRRGGRFHGTLFAIDQVLKGYGFGLKEVERWGGEMLRASSPSGPDRADHITSGAANAVFDEGIKSWGPLALRSGMRILPIKNEVLNQLERIGFSRAVLTPVEYPELDREVRTLDFSGWVFFCHRELPNSIAYGMAKTVDETHSEIPVDHLHHRGMTMDEFCKGGEGGELTIPLHSGAKKYYQERGYL